jgi:hypothetical protein
VIALASDELDRVAGGVCTNVRSASVAGVTVSDCKSDYAVCTDSAAALARARYPDTRPSLLGVPLPFTSDDNQAARAQATVAYTSRMCGTPSQP